MARQRGQFGSDDLEQNGNPAADADADRGAGADTSGQQREEPEGQALPKKIRMKHPHGFLDENERLRQWKAGDTITDPAEIALLHERKAPFEILDE
jgi:hypothetical protein